MDWGMKCSGLVPETVSVNVVNASCEIILLFWSFGSGVYALLSGYSSITAGCCGVPIRPNLDGVVLAIIVACTGLCIAEHVVNFFFSFGAVLTLFFARLSLGDSYHSCGCDLSSADWVDSVLTLDFGGVTTLELGGSMPGEFSRVVRCIYGNYPFSVTTASGVITITPFWGVIFR